MKYNIPIKWIDNSDPRFPFISNIDGSIWVLRLNDFPDEPLFTLFVDAQEIGSFDDPPECWDLP